MANTNFQNQSTVIVADWLNDVNDVVYDVLGDGTYAPTSAEEVRTNLGFFTTGSSLLKGSDDGGIVNAEAGVDYLSPTDPTVAKTDVTQTFTTPQRGTVTVDNDLSFNLNVTNNFKCTLTQSRVLTFTNITSGQSGYIVLVNSGGYAVGAAATTKISVASLTKISNPGTYLLSYFCDTNTVYVTTSSSLT